MKKQRVAILSLVVLLGTFLGACGNTKSTSSSGSEDSKHVLNLSELSEIPSLDPNVATDAVSFVVLNNVMEGLYRLGEDDKLVPGVAESYDVSDDGKTYTFHLREDAKWSNGDPVTANDFVYAWKRLLDPASASEYAYIMYDIKNAEKVNAGEVSVDELGVEATDDYTLTVELETAIPYFVQLTTFGSYMPLNEEFVTEQGEQFALEADTAVYNGPFVLSEWKHEDGWKYEKNDQYWDKGAVKLDEINVSVVKDTATAVNLYETDKLDRVALSAEFVDKYKDTEEFGTKLESREYFLYLNEEVAGLENVNLRKAIAMAYDKQGIVDTILNDGSVVANGYVPEGLASSPDGVDFREENGDLLTYNVEEAKKYWDKAKEELGVDSIELEMLSYDDDSGKKIAEFIQQELETNLDGLTVTIKQQPYKQKLELESNHDFQLSIGRWGADYPDPMTFVDMYVKDGPYNRVSFFNETYEQLVASAKGELTSDLSARWDALLEAEKILMDEVAVAPIYQSGISYVQKTNVKGIVNHSFGGDYSYKWAV